MKTECTEHQERIAALLLGDLAEDEKKGLEAHLAGCSQCRSEFDRYTRTLQQLNAVGDEAVPHHFFVYPEVKPSNPWQLFRGMQPKWQVITACAFIFMLLAGMAAVSRLQIQAGAEGWTLAFGKQNPDPEMLKKEILAAAREQNRSTTLALIREFRTEIERSNANLTKQQKSQLTSALAAVDSRVMGRISRSKGEMWDDTERLVSDLHRTLDEQRARDFELINLRLDSTDANNAIKSRQTNQILNTLLQVADLSLK